MQKNAISVVVPKTDRYLIRIETDLLNNLGRYLREDLGTDSVVVVTDTNVAKYHQQQIVESLEKEGFSVAVITLPPGERSKSLRTAERLFKQLLEVGCRRRTTLVAFGGGVVNDTVGFVASAYMRGIPYVNVPTTLLAQVDSAMGGKVAVNHPAGKNLIGAFYHPKGVYTDTSLLETLPVRHIRNGMAESIKTAIISDENLFAYIEENVSNILNCDPHVLETVVSWTAEQKMNLLESDPYEVDLRRPLNFGHTVGHAVEKEEAYRRILHGEAVAVGMCVATVIAMRRGVCPEAVGNRIIGLCTKMGLPKYSRVPAERIWDAMGTIKMIRDGALNYVMPGDAIGKVVIVNDIQESELVEALQELQGLKTEKREFVHN